MRLTPPVYLRYFLRINPDKKIMALPVIPLDPSVQKRLFIGGLSEKAGRFPVALSLRPTVLKQLRELTAGSTTLAIEFAVVQLIERMRAGETYSISADEMKLTPADRKLLERAREISARNEAERTAAAAPAAKSGPRAAAKKKVTA